MTSVQRGKSLSKLSQIRKKALDHVRKQNWEGAIKEFRRLAEIDQSNPNVYNELGDVYLKMGSRTEAFDSFQKAIDSYVRVSLHNNAVAVCKKVLRLIPGRYDVLVNLGTIRMKQGLTREGESYYSTYLEKVAAEPSVDRESFVRYAHEISEHARESVPVLQSLADCLFQHGHDEAAGETLVLLYNAFTENDESDAAERLRDRIEALGLGDRIDGVKAGPTADGPVITEDNIWTEAHSEGDRIVVDETAQPSQQHAMGAAENPAFETETVDIGVSSAAHEADGAAIVGTAPVSTPATPDRAASSPVAPPGAAPAPATPDRAASSPVAPPGAAPAPATPDRAASSPVAPPAGSPASPPPVAAAPAVRPNAGEQAIADGAPGESSIAAAGVPAAGVRTPPPDATPSGGDSHGELLQVSAILGDEASTAEEKGDADYRSHYDLGMAYLEMELYGEAIREFQSAAQSPNFCVKSMEMVGHCFIQQGQAALAIKQLTRGLDVAGPANREAIGIRYNLGIAYEMLGDNENARAQFEDVYVTDVTFREVAGKIKKYSAMH